MAYNILKTKNSLSLYLIIKKLSNILKHKTKPLMFKKCVYINFYIYFDTVINYHNSTFVCNST